MRQVTGLTSTYSSDEFGICSALFELGGLVVMHDASGCNSTYTTHDEPRWYDMDSMIYVSAISEMEAVMGDDGKLIRDLEKTAAELRPAFVAVIGAPIPYMIGTDLGAIAAIVEADTGIPSFGFPANGMGLYTKGISMALEALTGRFCGDRIAKSAKPTMNIIGATPLDIPADGVAAIWEWAEARGFGRGVCLSTGCRFGEIARAGAAHVNLVVSYGGLAAARLLRERYGTPYVAGVPVGRAFSDRLGEILRDAASRGVSCAGYREVERAAGPGTGRAPLLVAGESVFSASFAAAAELGCGIPAQVVCTVDTEEELLRDGDVTAAEEDDLLRLFSGAGRIAADPLFRTLAPEGAAFLDLPHTAFSGRIYDRSRKNRINAPLEGEPSADH